MTRTRRHLVGCIEIAGIVPAFELGHVGGGCSSLIRWNTHRTPRISRRVPAVVTMGAGLYQRQFSRLKLLFD